MPWDALQDFSIAEIIVNEAELLSDDPWTVIDTVSGFATAAIEVGGLNVAEMPREVLWSSQVTLYQSQVSMNGHLDFVCNSRWKISNVEACRNGIAACGASDYLHIFDELVALVDGAGIPGPQWNERRGEVLSLPNVKDRCRELDKRYFEFGERGLVEARIAWLRSLPNLRAVPGSQVRPVIAELTKDNPLREPRLAILEAERAEARVDHARERNTRIFLDDDVVAMGERMLAQLRRPLENDPDRLAPVYEIVAGQGIAWPVDPDCGVEGYLMLMPTAGTAALIIDFEPVCPPKPMPDDLRAYALEELAKAVSYELGD